MRARRTDVADDALTDEHYRNHREPAAQAALARRAGVEQEYSKVVGRTITFQDIPVETWRDRLLERGLSVYLVNHLATMADLHRAGLLPDVGRRSRANGATAVEHARVRQEECGDIRRVGKKRSIMATTEVARNEFDAIIIGAGQ